jgi:hypothetical protein
MPGVIDRSAVSHPSIIYVSTIGSSEDKWAGAESFTEVSYADRMGVGKDKSKKNVSRCWDMS